MTQHSETICALSSAPGKAGVAVVRVSGPLVRACLERLAGGVPKPRMAVLRTIRDPATGEDIDRAIVLFYAGPSSFTGEDVAEILLHGGKAVIAGVLSALGQVGCRLAEPGEFARRAFENGKIDLTEAEGIADLIDAETEAQRRQALSQANGALAKLYEGWRGELISAMALMEAAIDFSDEADVAADAVAQAEGIASDLLARIAAHLADGRRGEILREGFRVVLAGPPNAGKSSLLNALARRDAAIVSPEPGTTRDVIEVRLDLEGMPVIVSDTAGIRDGAGMIEAEGIRRTMARGREADLVLWLVDPAVPVWEVPEGLGAQEDRVARVLTKQDSLQEIDHDTHKDTGARDLLALEEDGPGVLEDGSRSVLAVSAVTGDGMGALVAMIAERARQRAFPGESPALTQARHRAALEDCARSLQEVSHGSVSRPRRGPALAPELAPELAAEALRRAARALGRITGRVDAEDVLDQVFGRFCIGK